MSKRDYISKYLGIDPKALTLCRSISYSPTQRSSSVPPQRSSYKHGVLFLTQFLYTRRSVPLQLSSYTLGVLSLHITAPIGTAFCPSTTQLLLAVPISTMIYRYTKLCDALSSKLHASITHNIIFL